MSKVTSNLGNENSARSFSDRSFLSPPSGHGRPRLRVMDVRTDMLVFPGFREPDRSFCPRTSAGISAWTSAGCPALRLTLWAAFSLLKIHTEQMGTEGLGRKLLLTTSGDPCRAPEKQTVGTVTASHKTLTLRALSSSLNVDTAERGWLGRGEAFG